MKSYTYTDEQLKFIVDLGKKNDLSWLEVRDKFNKKFGVNKTENAVRKLYATWKDHDFSSDEMLKNIRSTHSTKKSNSKLRKENKAILDYLEMTEDLIESVSEVIKSSEIKKVKLPKVAKNKKKKNMGVELFISDVHVGLKTKTYNLEVCEKRVSKYTEDAIKDIQRHEKEYNISKIHINFAGDLIQGENLHGADSQHSCEFSDARQMAESIRLFFYKVVLPVAKLGHKVDIIGIAGNHDRQSKDRPITNAGERYLTYTIYKSMELLCIQSGLTNVSWDIPLKEYTYFDMFGHNFIVEHGHAKGIQPNSNALEKQLLKRANQLGIIAKGIRIGHFHTSVVSNNGRHIVGPSPVSDDCFGDHLGYVSHPAMMINYYVETKERNTSFYHSFDVNLENIE